MQSSPRQLVWAVTAFSLAHCVTLGPAAMQLIAPDARWVEPAIALSIAYVGVENLALRPAGARVRLALVFGLLHGCGFGGALLELGMPLPAGAGAAGRDLSERYSWAPSTNPGHRLSSRSSLSSRLSVKP